MPRDDRSKLPKYDIVLPELEEAIRFIAFKSSLGLLVVENYSVTFLDICSSLHLRSKGESENSFAFGKPSSDLRKASQQLLNTFKAALGPERRGVLLPLPPGYSILGTQLLSTPLPAERFGPTSPSPLRPLSPHHHRIDRHQKKMKNSKLSSPPGRRASNSASADDGRDDDAGVGMFSVYDVLSSPPYLNSVPLFRHGQRDGDGRAYNNNADVIFLVIPNVDTGSGGKLKDQAILMLRINFEDMPIIRGSLTSTGNGITVRHPALSSIHVNHFNKFTESFTRQCGASASRTALLDAYVAELMNDLPTAANVRGAMVPVTETTYLFPHLTCNNGAFNGLDRQEDVLTLTVKFSVTNTAVKPRDILAAVIPEITNLETGGALGAVADGTCSNNIIDVICDKFVHTIKNTDVCVYAVFEAAVDSDVQQQRHTAAGVELFTLARRSSSRNHQLARSERPDPDGISMCASSNDLGSDIVAPTSLQTHKQEAIAFGDDATTPAPGATLISASSHQSHHTSPVLSTTKTTIAKPHSAPAQTLPHDPLQALPVHSPSTTVPASLQTHHEQDQIIAAPIATVITTRDLSSSPHCTSHVPFPTTTSAASSKPHSPAQTLPSLQSMPSLSSMLANTDDDNNSKGVSETFSSPDSTMSLYMQGLDEVIKSAVQHQAALLSDVDASTTLSIEISASAKAHELFERSIMPSSPRSSNQIVSTIMKASEPRDRKRVAVKKRKVKDIKHRVVKRQKTNASRSNPSHHHRTTCVAPSSDHILGLVLDMKASRRVLSTSRESGQGKFAKVLD